MGPERETYSTEVEGSASGTPRVVVRSPWLRGLASLVIPGLGQGLGGDYTRAAGLLIAVLVLIGLILWQGTLVLFVPLAAVWLWGAWDAYRAARGRPSGTTVPFLLAALIVYALAVRATELDLGRVVSGWPNIRPILRGLVDPDLLEYPTDDRTGSAPFLVPCVDPLPAPRGTPTEHPSLTTAQDCASLGDTITVEGEGFFPNYEAETWWQNPIGDYQYVIVDGTPLTVVTDGDGRFSVQVTIPTTSVPLDRLPAEGETQTHRVEVRQRMPYGSRQPTQTLSLVLAKTGETIALAFMATILALVLAIPLSLLASRNLMWASSASRAIYYAVRTSLNVVRSIETLVWAIIFGVWVGLGPFAGVLALFLHSLAALGKLYSEAIEGIDPGPIEAVRATGAGWAQVVVYAVVPQFLPSFTGFTLLRWDINVRMATVIGLVADAGLGFLIIQWIRLGKYSAMATAIIAIVLIVAALDYISAVLRQRVLVGGTMARRRGTLRRYGLPALLAVAFLVMFVWSWQASGIDIPEFVRGVPDGLRLVRAFFVPDLVSRPTEDMTVSAALPVPCESGETSAATVTGPRVNLSLSCGEVGDPLIITGHELPPNTRVSVRWSFGGGAYLRAKKDCCDTDDTGRFQLETQIHPLMEVDPESGQTEPAAVDVTWKVVVGGPQASPALRRVAHLALVTLLMALLSTTLGSLLAMPISFLAARNIVGRNVVGRVIYTVTRLVLNLWRSIEPLILAIICAAWVGFGPAAGVLALFLNNIPNLAKLFSEAIEEIDTGPVEAVTATGASRAQILVYAVVPQLVPRFLAYILYQWDINIRMSTVIGFVGGGGIGKQFREWVQLNQYSSAGTAIWAIVVMVWSMDYISAKVRERLT